MKAGRGKIFMAAAVACLAVTAFLHFYRLSQIPPGFHVDESSIGYNAYCISSNARDEHGKLLPIYFEAFGDYKNPLKIYLLAPVVKVFGLEKATVRAPSSIYHMIGAFVLFFLILEYTRSRYCSLAGAFAFSILPWIFPASRTGLSGLALLLPLLCSGWLFALRASREKSLRYGILSSIFFGLALYSTHSGKPLVVATVFCILISFSFAALKRRGAIFLKSGIVLGLFLIPVIITWALSPESQTNRFNAIAVWQGSGGMMETAGRIASRYLEYYGPEFLLVSGDPNQAHSTGSSGAIFLFMAPLVLAGIWKAIASFNSNPLYRALILLLITYPCAAMLTIGHMHSTCCLNGAIIFCVLFSVGLQFSIRTKRLRNFVAIPCMILALYEVPSYFHSYFTRYPAYCSSLFNASVVNAIEYGFDNLKPGDKLYLSKFLFYPEEMRDDFRPEWYAHILFFGKIPPYSHQKYGLQRNTVEIYRDRTDLPGLLVTLDSITVDDRTGVRSVMEFEKIPEDTILEKKFITPSGIGILVYRISSR